MDKALHIFISYSWDNEPHKEWILKLADYLIEKGGCDVTLDQYDLSTGGNMTHFMEKAVAEADKVLLVLTPNYKLKADGRQGGVGMEYSMISQGLYAMQNDNTKFLPILRQGSLDTSAPTYVQTTIYHDMSNDLIFKKSAFDLLRVIHNKPKLVKPKRGSAPNFTSIKETKPKSKSQVSDGFVESASKILKVRRLKKEIEELNNSQKGIDKVNNSVNRIFEYISKKSLEYGDGLDMNITSEKYNNNDSIRIQADDYYVIIEYKLGYLNRVSGISMALKSGMDKYYNYGTLNSNPLSYLLMSGNKSINYSPVFNNKKAIEWQLEDSNYTEDDVVNKVFTLLLEEIDSDNNDDKIN